MPQLLESSFAWTVSAHGSFVFIYTFKAVDGDNVKLMKEDNDRDYVPLWYVMDEFGSRVAHSDTPNMIFKSFYYVPTGISYTIIFPNKDVQYGGKSLLKYIADYRIVPTISRVFRTEN